MSGVRALSSPQELDNVTGLSVLNFWADWSKPCVQMNALCEQLSSQFPTLSFFSVEAERVPDITEKFDVTAVPYFIFLNGHKKVGAVEGANPPELTRKVKEFAQEKPVVTPKRGPAPPSSDQGSDARLEALVNTAPVMLFMKGNPDAPQCGFSSKIIQLLKDNGAQFSTFDILSDASVREGLKKYSNWPTYPQLYIGGKLVGGLDIVKELIENSEFQEMLPQTPKEDLSTRLEKLINSSPIMLFMKGDPSAPQCGFSSKIVKILQDAGAGTFGTFDILKDQEVRDGLKKHSNWPTYPQLYVGGKLLGGLDVVKEMHEDGELADALAQAKMK